jgi:hypothetical protein
MISHPYHFSESRRLLFNDINSASNADDLFSKMSVFRVVFGIRLLFYYKADISLIFDGDNFAIANIKCHVWLLVVKICGIGNFRTF